MASWQENLNSVVARLSHIFSSGEMSDVTFLLGEPPEQKRFQLHKLILSMSSDVFFAMFYGSLPEMGEVKVPDIQPDIFEITMKYVYEDKFSVETMEQAMYTYCASEKYNISHLRDFCASYITDNLNPENLPMLYRVPVLFQNLQIKSECETILSENTSDIMTSENVAEVPLDMVKDIVQLEKLNVSSDENLFELVLQWAKSICLKEHIAYTTKELRAVMDDFLPHIRFLGMSTDSFLLGPACSRILTDSEIASISQNLLAPGWRKLPVWCNLGMSRDTTRLCLFPSTESHNCLYTEGRFIRIEGFITIHIGNILFKGLTVCAQPKSDLPTASLEINKADSIHLTILEIISIQTECSYDPKTSLLKCMLRKPLLLSLSEVYQIILSSNSYIFSQCQSLHYTALVKRNQDFEMEYLLSRNKKFPGKFNGYAHFHEILYSTF